VLLALLLLWAAMGHLDIVASADGKLVPRDLFESSCAGPMPVSSKDPGAEGERVAAAKSSCGSMRRMRRRCGPGWARIWRYDPCSCAASMRKTNRWALEAPGD